MAIPKAIKLALAADVSEWLAAQPDGGVSFIEGAVREQSKALALEARIRTAVASACQDLERALVQKLCAGEPPVKKEANAVSPETREALKTIERRDKAEAHRAAALIRYPQLVDAVARELVSIDRAESMALEADARK